MAEAVAEVLAEAAEEAVTEAVAGAREESSTRALAERALTAAGAEAWAEAAVKTKEAEQTGTDWG